MPFGPYKDFDACLIDQQAKGHGIDSARRICGAMQAELEGRTMQRTDATPTRGKLQGTLYGLDQYSRSVSVLASTTAPAGDQDGITSWDFSTWDKNPTVLWAHDQEGKHLPVGIGIERDFSPNEGLKIRVRFATAAANPLAEQIWNGVCEQIVRAVSVGFEYLGNGKARLLELSFVPLGLDENAGTSALNPEAEIDEDQMRIQVASAASMMAKHRARMQAQLRNKEGSIADVNPVTGPAERTDMREIGYRYDRGVLRLDKFEETPSGGKKIPARLSRIGVLTYMNPDGTRRRELRLPEECFKTDSLKTLDHAVLIDIKHHTGMVTPDTWRNVALGSVVNPRHDATFITGDVLINDGMTLDSIEDGSRCEISLGYTCRLEKAPEGMRYDGQEVDFIQRDIRYNHAALCPPHRGRAGPEVGLRLDQQGPSWAIAHLDNDQGESIMNMPAKIYVRVDGKDYEKGSDEHLAKVYDQHKVEITQVRTDAKADLDKAVAEIKVRADKAEGERDELKVSLDATNAKMEKEKAKRAEDEAAAMEEQKKSNRSRRRIERWFTRYFGGEDMEEDEEEEAKSGDEKSKSKKARMDAFDDKLDSMSNRDIMILSIQRSGDQRFDGKDENGKDHSEDYLRARFDSAVERAREGRSVAGVVRSAESGLRQMNTDAGDDGIEKARADRDKRMAELGRK